MIVLYGCVSHPVSYDLPNLTVKHQPEWVNQSVSVRDTIFIVIHLDKQPARTIEASVQLAQSRLHALLMSNIELIVRDYWDQKQVLQNEDEIFQRMAHLPQIMEQIMGHVTVTDGWEKTDQVSILCALDYEPILQIIMTELQITDRSFRSYFKRRMEDLAQPHH